MPIATAPSSITEMLLLARNFCAAGRALLLGRGDEARARAPPDAPSTPAELVVDVLDRELRAVGRQRADHLLSRPAG